MQLLDGEIGQLIDVIISLFLQEEPPCHHVLKEGGILEQHHTYYPPRSQFLEVKVAVDPEGHLMPEHH